MWRIDMIRSETTEITTHDTFKEASKPKITDTEKITCHKKQL